MSLQDLSNYNEPIAQSQMDIRTEYVEPITSNSHKFTFRLDQSGYLDENSMLTFKLLAQDGTGKYRANCWNGVLGGIKRVIFQVGDNILNDIQEIYKYSTLKNMNLPPTMRNKKLGHYLGNQFHTHAINSANDVPTDYYSGDGFATFPKYNTQDTNARVGTIATDIARSGINFGKFDDGTARTVNSGGITNVVDNNQQYGIPLGFLIPAIRGQKIPLFLFQDQRILITVEFNTSEKYVNNMADAECVYSTDGKVATASSTAVVPTEVRLVVDYIIMPSEIQNEVVEQTKKEGGYRLEFYDVVNVEKNIPTGTAGTVQSIEHRIGQNGREVHNIIMWKEGQASDLKIDGDNAKSSALLLGQHCRGFEEEEYNCDVNGREEFPEFKFNPVSQWNEMGEVLGATLKVDRPMYCNDSNTSSTILCSKNDGMLGNMKPLGVSLRNGEPVIVGGGRQIGNYPIVWKWKRKCVDTAVQNCRKSNTVVKCSYFIEVSRVANIMNTGRGMNVVVSY
tara:strand:- start:519 stop:2039 length:1521 start_codon:yes stop_codon:yes gene_type:complete